MVDGWKQREAEKVNLIQQLQTEHEQLASQADAQQQVKITQQCEVKASASKKKECNAYYVF